MKIEQIDPKAINLMDKESIKDIYVIRRFSDRKLEDHKLVRTDKESSRNGCQIKWIGSTSMNIITEAANDPLSAFVKIIVD